jgi:hypothetical protein
MDEFNMYEGFIDDDTFATLPFFNIPETENDAYVEWTVGDRLDKLAYRFYDNPALSKFILLANPQYLAESDIEIGDIIRVPLTKDDMFSFIRQKVEESKLF